jgi:hypothetical protein
MGLRYCLSYNVRTIVKQSDSSYAGLVVASLSRQGDSLSLAVFDKNGSLLRRDDTSDDFASCWPLLGIKYLVEILHPPVLSLASFFTAYSFDAAAAHRATFLWPNSIVAQQRDRETSLLVQSFWALLFMVPALLFSGLLGGRVMKDAATVGLSRCARWFWLAGTLAFGLPAFIAYRLTRPRAALVRCRTCGNFRRSDMAHCHRCDSLWEATQPVRTRWQVVMD